MFVSSRAASAALRIITSVSLETVDMQSVPSPRTDSIGTVSGRDAAVRCDDLAVEEDWTSLRGG